jgi:hypothetical protein
MRFAHLFLQWGGWEGGGCAKGIIKIYCGTHAEAGSGSTAAWYMSWPLEDPSSLVLGARDKATITTMEHGI